MQRIAPDRKAILSWVVVLVVKRLKAGDHGIASDPNRKTNKPEKTRAAKSTAATKIQSAKKGNSVLERIFFMRFSSSGAFRRKVQIFCKAMTTAKGRIISSSPA